MSDSKKFKKAIEEIEKRHGRGSLVRLDFKDYPEIEVISTGSLAVDLAIGVDGKNCGIPRGRITELYGQESSGKSTMLLHVIGNANLGGGKAALIDAEHSLDPVYARSLGVNFELLYIAQPENAEKAMDIAEILINSESFAVVGLDSIAALAPMAEISGEVGDAHVGLQARLNSQFLRRMGSRIHETNTAFVIVNQLRDKIGGFGYGPTTTTPGGRALKHSASVRLEVTRTGSLKLGDRIVGARTKVKVAKNKLGPPYRTAEFDLIYGKGFSRAGELIDLGLKYGFLHKEGSAISMNGTKLGNGREQARHFLEEREISSRTRVEGVYEMNLAEQICQTLEAQIWQAAAVSPDTGDSEQEAGEEG